MKPLVNLLITDLDNTLWDWLASWHAGFESMIGEVVRQSGLERSVIEADMQKVFQKYGTTEYASVIEETRCLRDLNPRDDLTLLYGSAIAKKRSAREAALALYPGVTETLGLIRNSGTRIVAHTESREFYTLARLKKLQLDGVVDVVYSPRDHELPTGLSRTVSLDLTEQKFTKSVDHKPDPALLLEIIQDQGGTPSETVYIGDKLLKDIAMAQDAGVHDVFAAYGDAHDSDAYECLRRVTHWTQEQVERERSSLDSKEIVPSNSVECFSELLDLFVFSEMTRGVTP